MRNYIDEIDEYFIKEFLTGYFTAFASGWKTSVVIGKKENMWTAVCIMGTNSIYKLTFNFTSFSAEIKETYAPNLKAIWAMAMYKKFGNEYVKDLEKSYNVERSIFDKN